MPKKKKQAKAKTAKLPKEIAGIKITRELRSAIEPVLRFASHPMVSDTLAAALLAGASALTPQKGASRAKGAGKGAAAGAGVVATSGAKGRDSIGLMMAVAAGEIASRIVAAYQAPPDERRDARSDRRRAQDRRSGSGKAPARERRAGPRRAPKSDRRG